MLALKFQLLTGTRISEVAKLRVDDIKTDAETGLHFLMFRDTKGTENRAHYLPVPKHVAEILAEAQRIRELSPATLDSEIVFCNSSGSKFRERDLFGGARALLAPPMFEGLTSGMRPLVLKNAEGLDLIKPEPVEDESFERLIVSHDCRRTFETYGEEADIPETLRRSLTNHKGRGITLTYNLKSDRQKMLFLAKLFPEHDKYCELLFRIAAR